MTDQANDDLSAIKDTRTLKAVGRKIDELETEPDQRGKALTEALRNYRSVRAAGQRYRIIYQVAMLEQQVIVVVVGIRKAGDKRDAYAVAKKRLTR